MFGGFGKTEVKEVLKEESEEEKILFSDDDIEAIEIIKPQVAP